MCRLFGFRAAHTSHVDRYLVGESRTLAALSREHCHGWGIGEYRNGEPVVSRSAIAAHGDPAFERTARSVSSDCVVAHVRRRSVGGFGAEDNHPFRWGSYVFAHNGTVHGFEHARATLEAAIAPRFRGELRGATDSERCFYLFLSRLDERGLLESPTSEDFADSLASTIAIVRAAVAAEAKAPALNFLASDGRTLAGVRFGDRELWLSTRRGDDPVASPAQRVVVASEPLAEGDVWSVLGNGEGFAVGPDLHVRRWRLGEFARPRAA